MRLNFTPKTEFADGFAAGAVLARSFSLPTLAAPPAARPPEPTGPDAPARMAQDRFLADGKKLCTEEDAKRKTNGLDMWDQVLAHARDGRYPKGTDVFLFKFQGMFYVAPAQDSFMCRMRFAAGILTGHQLRGVAQLADDFAGGYADVTTRANLQLRQIVAKNTADVLLGLTDLGIVIRGSGADNIRNVTASPTAGIDAGELIDVRPLARQMHHYILNHRELYGLPRKFNIAFDGGGTISALEDTNDIGFVAVRVGEGHESMAPGIYLRMQLGGITGHKDFARDTGILLESDQCIPAAAAVVRAFIAHGDRTDRKKARLKYVLDRMGFDKFLVEAAKYLPFEPKRFPLDQCEAGTAKVDRMAHVGFHPQKQPDLNYVGVVLPVGRMRSDQMRGLADIADRHGSGTIRLTVWQNLLISDIPSAKIEQVRQEIEALGLHTSATHIRAGLVACTGSAGCKFAAGNTKAHAMKIAEYVEPRVPLDTPVNIHLTGCHHSCAQHYIGDIGLIATKVVVGEDQSDGYHIHVGGGFGSRQAIAREIYRDVVAENCPQAIERMLLTYLANRADSNETFGDFVASRTTEILLSLFAAQSGQTSSEMVNS